MNPLFLSKVRASSLATKSSEGVEGNISDNKRSNSLATKTSGGVEENIGDNKRSKLASRASVRVFTAALKCNMYNVAAALASKGVKYSFLTHWYTKRNVMIIYPS